MEEKTEKWSLNYTGACHESLNMVKLEGETTAQESLESTQEERTTEVKLSSDSQFKKD